MESAISSLSDANPEKKKKAGDYILNHAKSIKLTHLPALEAKLKYVEDEQVIFSIIKALSSLKSKKVCSLMLRYLSRENYKAKSTRVLWAIMEIFVENNDHRILKAMPVRLRFNRANYRIFAWAYGEFSDMRFFKDLYIIYKSAPSGEIKLYLRVALNKILKQNGIYATNEKQMASLLSMLRTTWDYIPGTSRSFEEDLSGLENPRGNTSSSSASADAGRIRENLERALDNANVREASSTAKKKKKRAANR